MSRKPTRSNRRRPTPLLDPPLPDRSLLFGLCQLRRWLERVRAWEHELEALGIPLDAAPSSGGAGDQSSLREFPFHSPQEGSR